jgi:hypothetical protein
MGSLVYAAAMSHVLYPDYYGKNVGPYGAGRSRRGGVEGRVSRYEVNVLLYRLKKDPAYRRRFRDDARAALAGAEITDEEREAFVRWDARRLNELGGSLHLLISIPGLGGH